MSGPITTTNGQIQKRAQGPGENLISLVEKMKGEIARALPKHMTPDRMARVAMTALRTNRDLQQCSPVSFAACVITLAQVGLEPNTPLGHAYLIPRRMKNEGMECTFIIGYQGLLDLIRRSGQVSAVWAYPVYRGDAFSVEYGLAPTIKHVPAMDAKRGPDTLTHVYAAARVKDSPDPVFVVLTKAEVEGYRARGGNRRFSPWQTDYEAMALKTAVRRLYRWLPKSIEVASALSADEAGESESTQLAAVSDEVREMLASHGHDVVDREAGELTADEEARLAAEAGGA